jgi:GNAT superfamily N-acetyltransferase
MFAVRRLAEADWPLAVPVLVELRPHLTPAACLARLGPMCAEFGYELYAAFDGDRTVGAMGLRPLLTLSRGGHLHVDDLVTAATEQGRGVGAALLNVAEAEARRRGLGFVYLDSRPTAEGFYLRQGFERTPPVPMRRAVSGRPATGPG